MMTSAGRFKSTTSQGSPSRSMVGLRPMMTPNNVPKNMAMLKETTTRASVVARLKKSAPERASRSIAATTAIGSGRRRLSAIIEATCQIAISSRSDRALNSTSVFRRLFVEGSAVELGRGADQFGAAELREDEIELARVRLLVRHRPELRALEIALAIKGERSGIGRADASRELLPIGIRMRQNVLRLFGYREEAMQHIAMLRGKTFVEDIADHRHGTGSAEALLDICDADQAPMPMDFEIDTEIPKIQTGIALALQRLLPEKGRRAVKNGRVGGKVDRGAFGKRLQQQPALIERSAGDAKLLALQVGEAVDRG